MSHDIFACLEHRPRAGGPWSLLAADVAITRHYTLWAVLAGVHNYHGHTIVPIARPRGLPDDLSFATQDTFAHWERGDASDEEIAGPWRREWGDDDPHYSYLDYAELVRAQHIFSQIEDDVDEPLGPVRRKNGPHLDLAAILVYLQVYEDNGFTTRMVFGFD